MSVFDAKGNWSTNALSVTSAIYNTLKPLLEESLSKGLDYSDFSFIVTSEVEVLIHEDIRHKRTEVK